MYSYNEVIIHIPKMDYRDKISTDMFPSGKQLMLFRDMSPTAVRALSDNVGQVESEH
jgi:hypothetical protein